MSAKRAIAVRYSSTVSSTMRSWSLTGKPLLCAAIIMLAARRLTSHSQGPGRVSSKSLTSNTSRRSGEAKTPKLDRCASPQHWTVRPRMRRGRQIAGHHHGGASIEREWRDQHPAVADRHELGHACRGLALEQVNRIDAVGRTAHSGRGWSVAPLPAPPSRTRRAQPPSGAPRLALCQPPLPLARCSHDHHGAVRCGAAWTMRLRTTT